MPTVSWKLPPPTHGDNSTTSRNKPPPLNRGESSMKKTPTDWEVDSEFDDDNPFGDDDHDNLTTTADSWKVPPSTLGDRSTKKFPTDWKDRSEFDDDSITPANNWKVPPSTLRSSRKTPTVRSEFEDDDSSDDPTTPANNSWKVPPSTLGSSKKTDRKVRSNFDDDKKDYSTPPANNWKVPPSTLGSTNTTQTGWKDRSLFGGNSKNTTPTDNGRLTPIIEDDGSSMTSSADNPKVPPSVHDNDNNSMKTIPTYTPYLQLPHLLSLAWVTYPVISLIFVAFRLQLSLASAENGLDNVKHGLLASCTAAEKSATAAASLPRYLAETSNQQFVDAANGVMNGAQSALLMSLTILEATINFIIDIFRSTFLCLLELAMGIGLSLVTDAVQAVCNSSLFLSYANATLGQHCYCKHRK